MRRPLCAFCLSALGVLVLCSFLPQMGLLLPSAAIFVVFCLLVWWRRRGREGMRSACFWAQCWASHRKRPARGLQDTGRLRRERRPSPPKWKHRPRLHGGPGERCADGRKSGREAVHFRMECASLPKCEAGGRIRGRFSLDVPDATSVWTTTPMVSLSARNICPGCFVLGPAKLPRPDGAAPGGAEPPCEKAWPKTPAAFWPRW